MNTIEQRLMQDIAAVSRGIVVTDSDLKEARSALHDRIEDSHGGRSRVFLAVAAAAAVATVGAVIAFQTLGDDGGKAQPARPPAPTLSQAELNYLTGSAPTPELIQGVWRLDDGIVSVRFGADGTVDFSNSGELFGHPDTTGRYTIDGKIVTFTTTTTGEPDCVDATYVMGVSISRSGDMRYALPGGDAARCAPLTVGRLRLEHALPTSKSLTFTNIRGWEKMGAGTELYGDFIAEGGGYVLELGRDNAYYVAADLGGVVDRGQWHLQGRQLVLTSVAASPRCAPGDTLVFDELEMTAPGTLAFRGTVKQNACGGTWTPTGWVRIPNINS
jgi:hypothetical protein